MADPQSDLSIRDGKAYVSLDHINTVLASLPETPLQATVASDLGPDGRLQISVQLGPIDNARSGGQHNVVQRRSGLHIHQNDAVSHESVIRDDYYYQDERLLLRQLQDLQLGDEDTLDQLLTNPHPQVLDQLEKARGSLVHLATSNDGRVFSVLIGSTAESEWMGEYPNDYFQAPTRARRMDDTGVIHAPVTPYQVKMLKEILLERKLSLSWECFRASLQILSPERWREYRRLVERPVDIEFLEKNLDDRTYHTIAQFMSDVELIRVNTTNFFGSTHMMTYLANFTVKLIFDRMNIFPAEEATPEPPDPLEAMISKERRLAEIGTTSGPVREMIYKHGTQVTKSQNTAGGSNYPQFVVPLGRVYVAQSPDAGMHATRHMVVMDVSSPRKALWLFWDHFTVNADAGTYRLLLSDQVELPDADGRKHSKLSRLADDISLWDVGGGGDGGDDAPPGKRLLDWDAIYVPDGASCMDVFPSEVLLDRTWNERVVRAIRRGWIGEGRGQSQSRLHGRDEDGNHPDEPDAKRWKPNRIRDGYAQIFEERF